MAKLSALFNYYRKCVLNTLTCSEVQCFLRRKLPDKYASWRYNHYQLQGPKPPMTNHDLFGSHGLVVKGKECYLQKKSPVFVHWFIPCGVSRTYSNMGGKSHKATERSNVNDWGSPEAEKLIIDIQDNYFDIIKNYDSLMVFFHTSWCNHCKKLKVIYGNVAVSMKNDNIPGNLAAIDLTKKMDVADMFGVISVPTLKYFRKGKFIQLYSGKRTPEDIIHFMKNPPMESTVWPTIEL